MASPTLKKYLPFLLIIAAFLIISILYAYPALSGKELTQGDNISWKGMSHEAKAEFERTNEPVLWSNSMFGGMPTYTFFVGKSNNYIYGIERGIESVLPKPAYFFFLAMICFFALMRVLGVNRWLAGIGAIAYAFSTYNPVIIAAGHDTKMISLAYMPAVIAGILLIYRGRYLVGAALTAISFGLMFSMQHFQIVYYMGIVLIGLAIGLFVIAIREGKVGRFFIASAVTVLALLVGAGPSAPVFLSTQEYTKETMRGGHSELTINKTPGATKKGGLDKEYAFRWSNGIGETFCILVPYLYGGASAEEASHAPATSEAVGGQAEMLPTYWGPQPSLAGPVYFGAVICFLFVLGMLVIRSPHKWWMLAVSILAVMMSWGKHLPGFNYWIFDHVPFMNAFRTPSMVLVIPEFLFPIVAIWGVQDVLNNSSSPEARKDLWKKVKIAAGITGGLALLLGLGGSFFFDFTNPAGDARYKEILSYLKEDRAAMARNSGLLSAFYIALAAGLIWAWLKDRIRPAYLMAGLGLIIAIDLIPTSWRYLGEKNYSDTEQYADNFKPRPADEQVLAMGKGDPYYRVLDLTRDTYNDAVQAYFHKCVGGYSPAKLEIYQDLIDVHMNGQTFNAQVLNMLNTRFIIAGAPQGQAQVFPNPTACGNAWFVPNIKTVSTADEEILAMKASNLGDTAHVPGTFNPRETAIVRNTFSPQLQGLQPGADTAASVKLTKYGLNDIHYQSASSREGLAVFSDIWYPLGWKAYVDGKETPIIRANYVLRALRLPAGTHKIDFVFHPRSFYAGNTVAGITSILLYVLLIAGIVVLFRSKKSIDGDEEITVS
jgi:hypothetical protein